MVLPFLEWHVLTLGFGFKPDFMLAVFAVNDVEGFGKVGEGFVLLFSVNILLIDTPLLSTFSEPSLSISKSLFIIMLSKLRS